MNTDFTYDVFLSYSSKDKSVVRELAKRLKTDGLRVWFDEWEIRPGDMIGKKIEEGLESSRVLVLAMSQNTFGSEWAALESGTFQFRDPTNKERRFIPLRLDDAEISGTLKQFAYVDWRNKSAEQYAKLTAACRSSAVQTGIETVSTERLKPYSVQILSLGHTDRIWGVALSRNGRVAISGSDDKTVRAWDMLTGRCLATLEGHTASVLCVGLSRNGQYAISGSSDKTVRVWDVSKSHCISILKGHKSSVLGVVLCEDGRRAISGSADNNVMVWDIETGRCLSALKGKTVGIRCGAISNDGRLAIFGSFDKTIRVLDVEKCRYLATLKGHTGSVWGVALSGDGRFAISGSSDKTVRVWDVWTGRNLAILEGHKNSVFGVALSNDGRRALSGSSDMNLRVWDVLTGRCLVTLAGHTEKVLNVALSGDGHFALSGSHDKTVRMWDVEKGRCLAISEGHTASILGVVLSSDANRAISGSADKTVRVWDIKTGRNLSILKGHTANVNSVSLSNDGRMALSGSDDRTVRVWDVEKCQCLATLAGHTANVLSVALSVNGERAISGSLDNTARIWDVHNGRCLTTLRGHTARILSVALSRDGRCALSGSDDNTIRVWNVETGNCLSTLVGHTDRVWGVALSIDGGRAISGSSDNTVRVWDIENARCLATLEGHTARVLNVAFSSDGRWAISGSEDKIVKVWDVVNGRCLDTLEGHKSRVLSVMLSDDGKIALSGAFNGIARIWHLTYEDHVSISSIQEKDMRYTNAKVLLAGESGVGKTGLVYRLTEDCFKESISTDGAWATQLRLPQAAVQGDMEKEIWLWDFAGQADYRLIHQLYMDETALAIMVFNPQSENPFDGLGQWDRDLQRAARRSFKKLLVAGRCDRGGLMVSRASIERFRLERGFAEYIETSALQGTGCDTLREAISRNISWNEIPWTASPRIFKLLKDEIINIKDEGQVLLRFSELKQQLEMRLPHEFFTLEQLRAVVGLLAGPGVVWQLEFGNFVLLQPARINSYAAAVIRSVRAHTDEIGCIAEEDVLTGKLDYQDMKRLLPEEEQIVLRAMHQTFVDHGLCLREHTEKGTLLIFPSYFKRERPELEGHPLVLVTYQFNGPIDEIYATLVVRLHHTAAFEKDRLWRFAADLKTPGGQRLGLKMTKKPEGNAELQVYFEPGISNDVQVTFIRYAHEHLMLKAQEVVRLRHYVCPYCHAQVENRKAIQNRLREGKKDILCVECEKRVPLWDLIEEKFASEEFQRRARELEEQAKASIDNESRELILVGHTYAIAGEAGQIYRQYANSDHGIDGEIEFKDDTGRASGQRLYLQLKSGDSYLYKRQSEGTEIFQVKNERHSEYWQKQAYPVMLVIRTSDGSIRWMDVSDYLKNKSVLGEKIKRIVFDGEPFTALNLRKYREKMLKIG